MGSGRWNPDDYAAFSASTVGKSTADIYASKALHASLDPRGITMRESRDSALNPASTAIIVALDVTGSMGILADVMAREGLGVLFTEIYDRKPVSDPHIMFMAVGDADYDRSPLQASQFEADKRIIEQLTNIYLEHGGGGNDHESYTLPWYFGAMKTSIDCVQKRGKLGYLITVGDEECPTSLTREQIEKVLGDKVERDLPTDELLQTVSRLYHVFHIMVMEGNHARAFPDAVKKSWMDVLGQRAIPLSDHKKLSEVVVSLIEITEGKDKDAVAASWSASTAIVVREATKHLPQTTDAGGAVERL